MFPQQVTLSALRVSLRAIYHNDFFMNSFKTSFEGSMLSLLGLALLASPLSAQTKAGDTVGKAGTTSSVTNSAPKIAGKPNAGKTNKTDNKTDSKTNNKPDDKIDNKIEKTVVVNPQSPLVRVCLLRYSGAETIGVTATAGAHLMDAQGQEVTAGYGPWTFHVVGGLVQASDAQGKRIGNAQGGAVWRVQLEDGAAQIGVQGQGGKPRHYHGSLEIRATEGSLRLINEVGMEPYLQGVVISEIGDGPLEALKAQVIAARTYAISSRGRWKSDGYDLRDSVDSQAYDGVEAETADGNRAVLATTGQILTVNGLAIDSDFCDDCGGVTAPGDSPDILPRSVSDAEAHRYIRRAPYTNWTLTLSSERLKALVSASAKVRGQGKLQSIEVVQRDVSGRAALIHFKWGGSSNETTGSDRKETKSKEESRAGSSERESDEATRSDSPSRHTSRKRPQSPVSSTSKNLDTEVDGEHFREMVGYNVLRSTLFTVHRNDNGDFVFEGHGWGHGHGLCQQGALALAAAPLNRDCKAILLHYYPGAQLTRWQAALAEGENKGENKRENKGENKGENRGASKGDVKFESKSEVKSEVKPEVKRAVKGEANVR